MPPKGAPNVLLIMTDDQGYGVTSTFGGVIPTPNMDKLAKAGLRYTQFHSSALCSPTRAAIITGRNHHSVGFGVIGEMATVYPGHDSIIGPESATIGRILSDNGYPTSWFGKNHNTPSFQYSTAGPFDQWPSGMGFQYFYGFMGGETDQWTPYLFRNHTPVFPWVGRKDYNLITDIADDAIGYMKALNASAPEKPFFVYYVPGATHDPHHPTKEWIDRISEMRLFDQGWEKLREQIFGSQSPRLFALARVPHAHAPARPHRDEPAGTRLQPEVSDADLGDQRNAEGAGNIGRPFTVAIRLPTWPSGRPPHPDRVPSATRSCDRLADHPRPLSPHPAWRSYTASAENRRRIVVSGCVGNLAAPVGWNAACRTRLLAGCQPVGVPRPHPVAAVCACVRGVRALASTEKLFPERQEVLRTFVKGWRADPTPDSRRAAFHVPLGPCFAR